MEQQTRNDLVVVGTTQVILSLPNNSRKAFVVKNVSAGSQIITLSFGIQQAENKKGIPLQVNDHYAEVDSSNFECYKGQLVVISDGADAELSIMERF